MVSYNKTVFHIIPVIPYYLPIPTTNIKEGDNMNMDTLVKQSLEAAMKITGADSQDQHTQEVAFKLACAAMAEELCK